MSTVVGLVQVNWAQEWHGSADGRAFDAISYSVLPYSTGTLEAYARHHLASPESFRWLPHVFERGSVAGAVDQLVGADVVGFSAYIWNVRLSLAIAEELHRRRPETLIVFGGPQVPDRAEPFLRAHPWVDIVCHGEGEAVFTAILEASTTRRWEAIPAVSYLDEAGSFVSHPKAARTQDLSRFPSPYLEGVFDELVAGRPGTRWIMSWETNRGCPFSCTFCDWGSATQSRVYTFDEERLRAEMTWAAEKTVGVVFCCDANFGMLPRDVGIAEMVVETHRATGYPYTFSIQNAKNSTERSYQIQKLLAENMQTTGVTLSLQTTDPGTLRNIRRANIRSDSYRELQRRFNRDRIYTYTDVILGLPGESYDAFTDSVARIIADGQSNHIEFYNCSVLPNAEMAAPAYMERFGLVTASQAIRPVYSPADWDPDVEEFLPIVVSNDALSDQDWVRAKVFSWMTDLLYFDRLAAIPLHLLHALLGISYRSIIEALVFAADTERPTFAHLRSLLEVHARQIQHGGVEFFRGGPGGAILWPADQFAYTTLVAESLLDSLYGEIRTGLIALATEHLSSESTRPSVVTDPEEILIVLDESMTLNRALLRLPGDAGDTRLALSHDILGFWRRSSSGDPIALPETIVAYTILRSARSWESLTDWADFLTWCQRHNKREYLHGAEPALPRRRGTAGTREPSVPAGV